MKTFSNLKARSATFLRDDSGASAIEYGLIAAGIAIAIATTVGTVGVNLSSMFSTVAGKIGTPTATP